MGDCRFVASGPCSRTCARGPTSGLDPNTWTGIGFILKRMIAWGKVAHASTRKIGSPKCVEAVIARLLWHQSAVRIIAHDSDLFGSESG